MRLTTILGKASSALQSSSTTRRIKSLAFTSYFKQPAFGMTEYEILSRSSAFLLSVDAPDDDDYDVSEDQGPYSHLEVAERFRTNREAKLNEKYSKASGKGGRAMDMGWLEFIPRQVRPQVHVVTSSHVVAPFRWREHYPQDWLKHVREEHCAYALEVFDPSQPDGPALAKFALHNTPFHHPEGVDMAILHLQEEAGSLKIMRRLGVEKLYLRDIKKIFEKGEQLFFDGFVVTEPNTADTEDIMEGRDEKSSGQKKDNTGNEDTRVFVPHVEKGELAFAAPDRFFATTTDLLAEGLCGGPVIDSDGDVCGIIEGIVPPTDKDKTAAGCAVFIPSPILKVFVDSVEYYLAEKMMPDSLFQKVKSTKKTNILAGGLTTLDKTGEWTKEVNWIEGYEMVMKELRKQYNEKEINAIMETVEQEREEALKIFNTEGGDMDEILQRVRQNTRIKHEAMMQKLRRGELHFDNKP